MKPGMLEAFPFEIVIIDDKFTAFLYANRSARHNLGYSLKELLQLSPAEFFGKQQSEEIYRRLTPVPAKEKSRPPGIEVIYRRKNASHYPVKVYFKHCTYKDQDCFMATSVDISDRRSHTDRRAIEHLPAGAVVASRSRIYINRAATLITGYDGRELDSLDQWYALFPRNVVNDFKRRSKSGNCAAPSVPAVVPIATKSQGTRLIELSHHSIDESMSIWMFQDVTEREQLQAKLRWSEAKASAVLNTVPDGIVNINREGRITSFNQAAENIFDYRAEDVLGQEITLLLPGARRDRSIGRYLQTGREGSGGNSREAEAVNRRGETMPIQLTVIEVAVGDQIILTCLIKDLTEQKEMERISRLHSDEVRQYHEDMIHISRIMTLSEIATGIAHEINQPLASISTYAQACLQLMENARKRDGTFDSEQMQKALHQISRQSHRAAAVISHLRAQIKQREIDPIPIDINKLIEYTLTLLQGDLKDQNIILQTALEADLPAIKGIPIQLQQILFNLILNAIDAINSHDGKQRCIKIQTCLINGDSVRISVSDSGIGIAKADRDRIFTSYFSTKASGMGIGLSICQSIIRGHRGTLDFNHRKRKGAEFYFTLPAYDSVRERDYADASPSSEPVS